VSVSAANANANARIHRYGTVTQDQGLGCDIDECFEIWIVVVAASWVDEVLEDDYACEGVEWTEFCPTTLGDSCPCLWR
jgi:hypothetical protein